MIAPAPHDAKCHAMLPFDIIKKAHDQSPHGTNACQALTSLCEVFHPDKGKLCVIASSTPSCHTPTNSKHVPTCKHDLIEHGYLGMQLKTWAQDARMHHLSLSSGRGGDRGASHFSDSHLKPTNNHNGAFL